MDKSMIFSRLIDVERSIKALEYREWLGCDFQTRRAIQTRLEGYRQQRDEIFKEMGSRKVFVKYPQRAIDALTRAISLPHITPIRREVIEAHRDRLQSQYRAALV